MSCFAEICVSTLHCCAPESRDSSSCCLCAAHTYLDSLMILQDVKQSDFKLPTLGPKLVEFRDEAVNGRGFVLLRGLPVNEWPVEEVAIAYWGLGTYWGKAQPQNRLHHLLGHVKVCKGKQVISPLCSLPAVNLR